MQNRNKIRIYLNHNNKIFKVSCIILSSDGSFKIDCPYVPYSEGAAYLFPSSYANRPGTHYVPIEHMRVYKAKNRPQLSIHPSGYIQFSGKNIKSGIDPLSKSAKGVGVYSNPFSSPIMTGPTFGILVWNLSPISLETNIETDALVLTEKDIIRKILRDYDRNDKINTNLNTYQIEFWLFHESLYDQIYLRDNQEVITLSFPQYYESPGAIFTLPIIRLKNTKNFLGVQPFLCHSTWPEKIPNGGYAINGPGGSLLPNTNKYEWHIAMISPPTMFSKCEEKGGLDYPTPDTPLL